MTPETRAAAPRSACQANANSARVHSGTNPARPTSHGSSAGGFACTLCGGGMLGVHCKLICSNCGYREDCSDLFRADSIATRAETHVTIRPQ